jgi:hypothetical protein
MPDPNLDRLTPAPGVKICIDVRRSIHTTLGTVGDDQVACDGWISKRVHALHEGLPGQDRQAERMWRDAFEGSFGGAGIDGLPIIRRSRPCLPQQSREFNSLQLREAGSIELVRSECLSVCGDEAVALEQVIQRMQHAPVEERIQGTHGFQHRVSSNEARPSGSNQEQAEMGRL